MTAAIPFRAAVPHAGGMCVIAPPFAVSGKTRARRIAKAAAMPEHDP